MKLFSRFLLGLLALFALAAPAPAQVVSTQAVPVLTAPNPCVIPSLSLNFVANGGSGVYCLSGRQYTSVSALPGWTFSRTGQGYAERSDGTLVLFGSGVPRITDKGLLVEEARTNLLLWSQDQTQAAWTKMGSTTVGGSTTAPDGTSTAQKLVEGATTSNQGTVQNVAKAASALTYTYTLYVKPAERTSITVWLNGASTNDRAQASFDLSGGTISTAAAAIGAFTGASASISPAANGLYRIVVAATSDATTTLQARTFLMGPGSTASAPSYTGNGVSGLYVWGADLTQAAFALSYIPTSSASATRGTDAVSVVSLSVASPWTMVAGFAPFIPATVISRALRLAEFGTSNTADIGISTGSPATAYNPSTGITAVGYGSTYTNGQTIRAALNNVAGTMRGSATGLAAVGFTGSAAIGVGSTLYVGNVGDGSRPINGYVQKALIYGRAFSDAELQGATQ